MDRMSCACGLHECVRFVLDEHLNVSNMWHMQQSFEQLMHVRAALQSLVVLKWLGLQAGSNVPGNVKAVTKLMDHAAFNINNPNKWAQYLLRNALLVSTWPA
jgi:Domain of unknown function (DUF3458_C) ARM repeats